MYFNQISKKIGIGQQAMLRHMAELENAGFVSVYGEKSEFGAPERKYYHLDSSFNLSISLSKDVFSIVYYDEKISDKKINNLLRGRYDQISNDPGFALEKLRSYLIEIDDIIENLQNDINNLKAMRQALLQKLHKIGQDNFVHLERKIIYKMMRENPSTISELSQMIDENKSDVRHALDDLHSKIDNGKMNTMVEDLTT
jgi:predicted transcriptional regulator